MRSLTLFLLLAVTFGHTSAQSTPQLDPNVSLKVSIASNQREFRMGERIPLQLAFSSSVKDRYQLNMAQYDRSGRMDYEHFSVSPAQGAVDPLPTYSGSMGGLRSFTLLTPEPSTIKLNLNEWVRFTQPGEYRLSITSYRVGARDPSSPLGASPVTMRSNEITLKIVPANRAWQSRVLSEAGATLDAGAPTKREQTEQDASRREALETLRFLGTADAVRVLAKRMRGEDPGGLDHICRLGLISSPERAAARSALAEALADPDHPIDGNFIYTLRMVNSDSSTVPANWRDDQRRAVEELLAALPKKRGKALSISLSTAVNEAWNEV